MSTLYTFIVAVAKLPRAKLLWRVNALILMGSVVSGCPCAAAAAGLEIVSSRLDASDKVLEAVAEETGDGTGLEEDTLCA